MAEPEKGAKVESPGMKYKHYAPCADVVLVEGSIEDYIQFVNSMDDGLAVCFKEDSEKITVPKLVYGSVNDENTLAHDVFSALRKIDSLSQKKAYIHAPSKNGVGLAVYNRLIRACGFKVIRL